jgi:hypothetical protein
VSLFVSQKKLEAKQQQSPATEIEETQPSEGGETFDVANDNHSIASGSGASTAAEETPAEAIRAPVFSILHPDSGIQSILDAAIGSLPAIDQFDSDDEDDDSTSAGLDSDVANGVPQLFLLNDQNNVSFHVYFHTVCMSVCAVCPLAYPLHPSPFPIPRSPSSSLVRCSPLIPHPPDHIAFL